MKSNFKKFPGSKIELNIELSKEEFDQYYQPVYEDALSKVDLKGFRPGTAPREMADKAVNKEKVFEQAAQSAVRFSLDEVIRENNWTVIDKPEVEITSGINGLKFKADFIVLPEVDLKNYQKIAHGVMEEVKEKVKDIKAEEKEVDETINYLRGSRAKTTAVATEAKKGDVVDIDFEGFVDGKPLPNSNGEKQQFILGEGRFIPGFEENIVGHKTRDEFDFTVDVPADYWQKDLQGKKIDFKVKINNVLERELPELNDEFAKSLGKFNDVGDFRVKIGEGIVKEKETKEREKAMMKIIEEISKQAEIDVPEIMIEKTKEMNKDDSEEAAKDKVVGHLIINKISQEQHLEPTKEEIELEIAKHQHDKALLDNPKFYDYVYGILQNRKVFEYLEKL